MKKANEEVKNFVDKLVSFYGESGRQLPWRMPESDGTFDGYKIMVSEIMLQQTGVSRVLPKYHEFIRVFPTATDLAQASLGDVLAMWSGLGYNRRAKFLHESTKNLIHTYKGTIPNIQTELQKFPGIGPNTAAAVIVYTYNLPLQFIETNIRSVWLHTFFAGKDHVEDADIVHSLGKLLPYAAKAFDGSYRDFYWALMDYGTWLKKHSGGHLYRSTAYTRQSTFHGSKRQIRGAVLKQLAHASCSHSHLEEIISDSRLADVLRELEAEGLLVRVGLEYSLPY